MELLSSGVRIAHGRQRQEMGEVPKHRVLFCEHAMNRVALENCPKIKPAVWAAGFTILLEQQLYWNKTCDD